MRKIFTSLFVAGALLCNMSVNAQNLLYQNDFESADGLNGATIVGNGLMVASGDPAHGQVFHNSAGGQAIRSNYLLLPPTIFADLKTAGTNAMTISFWVNKGTASNYYWSTFFSAYGSAPSPTNGVPMFALFDRGWVQENDGVGNWSDFNGAHTESTAWIDGGGWKFYTATITTTSVKTYIDGVLWNSWTMNGTNGLSTNGLFTTGSGYNYICLGGNAPWNWGDPDPAFLYDKLKIYDGALTAAQISSLKDYDQLNAPVVAVSPSNLTLNDFNLSGTIVVNGANLSNDIVITAPTGVTVNPATIPMNTTGDVNVTVTYDGITTPVSGDITLTSGSIVKTVPVTASVLPKTNPGTENLTHLWSFDDGTANDQVGTANGILMGGASIANKALVTSVAGDYLELPAADIAVNTYPAVTTEVWFTSGANGGNTMLSYLGGTGFDAGWVWAGNEYLYSSSLNGGNSRVAISTNASSGAPWGDETGFSSSSKDNGQMHQMVATVDATDITMYVDGLKVGSSALSVTNNVANLGTTTAYLAKSGYSTDPTWKGQIHKFSMYNKALTASDVAYLFSKGAETQQGVPTSTDKLSAKSQNVFVDKNNNLVVEFTLIKASDATISVYDIQGKLILNTVKGSSSGYNKIILGESLAKGTYIVKVVTDEFTISKKIIQ